MCISKPGKGRQHTMRGYTAGRERQSFWEFRYQRWLITSLGIQRLCRWIRSSSWRKCATTDGKGKEYQGFRIIGNMLWYKSGTEWRKKHLPALRLPRLPGQRPQPGTARPLPLQNDHIRHFSAQPIIYPLNSIKRFPAPVSAPQAYYDCCNSHM